METQEIDNFKTKPGDNAENGYTAMLNKNLLKLILSVVSTA